MNPGILNGLAAACWIALTLGVQAYAGQIGGVAAWGNQAMRWVQPETDFTAIAAGGYHCFALKSDGSVVTWGQIWDGSTYVTETVPSGLTGVISIAAGAHSLALRSDGTVVAWGWNSSGQSTVPGGLSGAIAIAAGSAHSLALKSDGTVAA